MAKKKLINLVEPGAKKRAAKIDISLFLKKEGGTKELLATKKLKKKLKGAARYPLTQKPPWND